MSKQHEGECCESCWQDRAEFDDLDGECCCYAFHKDKEGMQEYANKDVDLTLETLYPLKETDDD
jgi:hypothetical protein